MRTTVERRESEGFFRSSSSTALIRVVLPEPEEPINRMLPAESPASFFDRATEISRTASGWPITRFSSAAAICAGEGGAATAGILRRPQRAC